MNEPLLSAEMLREALLIVTVTGLGYFQQPIELGTHPQHICQDLMPEAVHDAINFGYDVDMVQCRARFYAPAHSLRPRINPRR